MLSSLFLAALLWTIPPSLEARRPEVTATMAESVGVFKDQCLKYQPAKQCDRALARAKIKILDTDRFKCGKVTNARGCFVTIRNITVAFNHPDFDAILTHEVCHFFGPKSGHNGNPDCKSVK